MDDVVFHDLRSGDAGELIQRHGGLYARDEGFDSTFEALVAEILADFMRNRETELERAWIAEADGRRLGSIFCVKFSDQGVAKLRLFLVEPDTRGLGLGQELLSTCLIFAAKTGDHAIRLRTHESHRAACVLYTRNGFQCTKSEYVRSCGVNLVEHSLELELQ